MAESEAKMFDLIDALEALYDEGIPVFPGRSIIDAKNYTALKKHFLIQFQTKLMTLE